MYGHILESGLSCLQRQHPPPPDARRTTPASRWPPRRSVAQRVATLVRDGNTLQFGLGQLQGAALVTVVAHAHCDDLHRDDLQAAWHTLRRTL